MKVTKEFGAFLTDGRSTIDQFCSVCSYRVEGWEKSLARLTLRQLGRR